MKRLYAILLACAMPVTFTACTGGSSPAAPSSSQSVSAQVVQSPAGSESTPAGSESAPAGSESTPVSSESAPAGSESAPVSSEAEPAEQETGKALVVYFSWSGNTESVAAEIQKQTGADSFELVPSTPYTDNYNDLLDLAQQEQRNDARPAISGSVDLSGYDTIYLGYPNWWGGMPMIIYSFLDDYDLSGKTVAPFCTSGGSGLSGSVSDIGSAEPNATVLDGLHIGSGSASNSADAVTRWLESHV